MPELVEENLTTKLSSRVSEAFVTRYGKYAGWAQILALISSQTPTAEEKKATKRKGRKIS